jgi:hypothetical protein
VLAHLSGRSDLDAALLPGEALSDLGIFLDDVLLEDVADRAPMPIFPSYDFADALRAVR